MATTINGKTYATPKQDAVDMNFDYTAERDKYAPGSSLYNYFDTGRNAKIAKLNETSEGQSYLKSQGIAPTVAATNTATNTAPNNVTNTTATNNTYKMPDIASLLGQYRAPAPVDNSAQINSVYGTQLQMLKDAIAASKAKLPGTYDPQRTQANVSGMVGALGDQERLASQGLANSGEAESTRIARQTGVGNAINSLNLQQNQANSDLDQQLLTGTHQNQVDLAKALMQNNTDMYNQSAAGNQNNISNILAGLGLQNTMNNDKFNQGIATANITGVYNGQQTLAGKESELNNTLTKLGIDTAKLNLAALPQQIKDQATLTLQSIQKGDIDIETGKAQLKELTDPNSITNKLAKLNLDTAQFNYNQLPIQSQQQAEQVATQLESGKISNATAQWQLQNLKSGLNADGTEISTSTSANKAYDSNYAEAVNTYANESGDAMYDDLTQGKDEIIKQVGQENYTKLVNQMYEKYYQGLVSAWGNTQNPEWVISALKGPQKEYYSSRLGASNYNKLLNSAYDSYKTIHGSTYNG